LVEQVAHLFPDSSHVKLVNLDRALDVLVREYAKENGYTLVTKDKDFIELTTYLGYPPKLVYINEGNCSVARIVEVLQSNYELITTFNADETRGVLIL
jgi:predicted nuclease of predicted toxin-antitoxin system